jgi:hypothetical protein
MTMNDECKHRQGKGQGAVPDVDERQQSDEQPGYKPLDVRTFRKA